jgi:hypothetical protein
MTLVDQHAFGVRNVVTMDPPERHRATLAGSVEYLDGYFLAELEIASCHGGACTSEVIDWSCAPLELDVTIAEGPRTQIGSIAIQGESVLTEAQIRGFLTISPARAYNEGEVAIDRDRIDLEYRNRGYDSVEARSVGFEDRFAGAESFGEFFAKSCFFGGSYFRFGRGSDASVDDEGPRGGEGVIGGHEE